MPVSPDRIPCVPDLEITASARHGWRETGGEIDAYTLDDLVSGITWGAFPLKGYGWIRGAPGQMTASVNVTNRAGKRFRVTLVAAATADATWTKILDAHATPTVD